MDGMAFASSVPARAPAPNPRFRARPAADSACGRVSITHHASRLAIICPSLLTCRPSWPCRGVRLSIAGPRGQGRAGCGGGRSWSVMVGSAAMPRLILPVAVGRPPPHSPTARCNPVPAAKPPEPSTPPAAQQPSICSAPQRSARAQPSLLRQCRGRSRTQRLRLTHSVHPTPPL